MHDIWNPWHGCTKCSEGCRNCYMYALDEMRGVERPSSECFRTKQFDYPLKKDRHKQYKIKPGERIRVNMTSDTFLKDADPWRDEMWDIIRQRPDVIFWLLTKRPERVIDCLPPDWGDGWDNVSMNITCENQEMFTKRLPHIIDIPAKHKGLCLAPLISDIDLTPLFESSCKIDEIGCGGENYNDPRPCRYEWVKHISDTCAKYKVNFCWYETGTKLIYENKLYFMPQKSIQSEQAYLAGLNHHFNDITFSLKFPDGQPVTNPYTKVYNIGRCLHCSNAEMCNGCSSCGACEHIRLVTFKELQKLRLNS